MLSTETDPDIRIELVTSLGLLGEKSATVIAALTKLMTDANEDLRRRAVRTLGTFGSAAMPVADAILKVAGTEKVKDIRVDAVHAFGSAVGVELKERVKDLLPILLDRDYEVRLAVVEEIGALGHEIKGDAAIMKALRARLSDPHVKVREAAAMAIRQIEKKRDSTEPEKEPEPRKGP
jgi:HEAT repeat protein